MFNQEIKSPYIKKILSVHLFIYLLSCFFTQPIYSKTHGKNALNSPAGSLLAHIGLGVATNGDSSIADINPALLAAMDKQYSLFGNLNFHEGFALYEVGILDTVFAPVAALLKARQTTNSTSEIDRRIQLSLAYQFPKTNFSLGITGDYEEHQLKNWTHPKNSGASLSVGGLYQVNYAQSQPLFIGASVTNIFDKFNSTAYNIGISKGFAKELYRLHADGTISNLGKLPEIAAGLDMKIRRFFILSTSIGWDFDAKTIPWGAGIYFDGPRLKAFYSIATHQANTTGVWQSTGVVISF